MDISLATRFDVAAHNATEPQYFDVKRVIGLRSGKTGGRGRPRLQALCMWRGKSWGNCSWTSDLSTMRHMVQ